MGLKGGRRHLKKLVAPKSWNMQRKGAVWVTKPRAGNWPAEVERVGKHAAGRLVSPMLVLASPSGKLSSKATMFGREG